MAPQAALDQHVDLALEQLVQARWLANADSNPGLISTELREPPPQIVDVDAAMYPNMQQVRDALGLSSAVASAIRPNALRIGGR
jgi:hypothetical protein